MADQIYKNSAEYRWEQKEIIKSKTIYDCDSMRHAFFSGFGSFEYTNDFVHPRHGSTSIVITTNTDIQDIRPRPSSNFQIPIDHENWEEYNRISVWVYPMSQGFQNFYFHLSVGNAEGQTTLHAPSLTPNVWNHVMFEMSNINRSNMTRVAMGPLLMGCPPEALPVVKFYFSHVIIEQVKVDLDFGWQLQEGIAYCHSGYFLKQEKKALIKECVDPHFSLFDENHQLVYQNHINKIANEYGVFHELDFSNFEKSGNFYLKAGHITTPLFEISSFPFKNAVKKSLSFLHQLRCGCEIQDVHSVCHITHHTIHPVDGRLISDNGGWHDAGDVSQFEICTAEIVHSLIDCSDKVRQYDQELAKELLEEARWGANWLLKTHFGDGNRALAVLYSVWTSNQIKSADLFQPNSQTSLKNVAENGPFENFLASAALSATAKAYLENDEIFSSWCLRIAIADFQFGVEGLEHGLFTRRWGKGPVAQVSGSLVLAASQLYEITKENKYLDYAVSYADEVIACQEQFYQNWEKPLRGFFYENPSHETYLTYEHRGHEQSPITGIIHLCKVAPHHEKYADWIGCLQLYQEYILRTKDEIAPYGLIPAHIYECKKINLDRFTIPNRNQIELAVENLNRQIKKGKELNEDVFLRRFPIAIQRRGFHATLLSKTKAISAIGELLHNEELRQVAIRQCEWVLGKNPFASSTLYGEGHNYHPLYVAFSRQLVGALPVGIETKGDEDVPFWPVVNNAVYKEVWGHTTAKFLWVIADLIGK